MSAKQTIELDAEILAAFQALDAAAPEDHLDAFEARLLARLEEDDMSEIANETTLAAEGRVAAAMGNAEEPQDGSDDAELHDIRALASSTKLRISQRMAAQADPDEVLLSSSSLALRTISLPEPGKDHPVSAPGEKPAARAAAHEDDAGLPAWIYAAISAVAAAAIVFFILSGQKGDEPVQTASTEPSTMLPAENLAPTGQGFAGTAPEAPHRPEGVDSDGTAAGNADTTGTDEGAASPGAQVVEGSGSTQSTRVAAATRSGDTTAKSARRTGAGDAEQKPGESAASAAPPAEASAEKTKKPEKKSDALDELLTEASGGAAGGAATGGAAAGQETGPAANKPTRTRLDSGDIKSAMTPIGPKAQACRDESQVSGMVTVQIEFRVEPSGAITSAAAKGKFKGTPTGECVARAVKTAKLPPYDGAPMTFTYPFLLTQ